MAEGLLRSLSHGRVDVFSAGTHPRPEIHPLAIEIMRNMFGIDLHQQFPKTLDRYLSQRFDYVITVCDRAGETCPVFPGHPNRIHWSFPDPALVEDEPAATRAFEQTAQAIAARLRQWLETPEIAERLAGNG